MKVDTRYENRNITVLNKKEKSRLEEVISRNTVRFHLNVQDTI